MNAALQNYGRSVSIGLAVITLVAAVVVLAVDWVIAARTADALADRLAEIEDTARDDPESAAAFEVEVERQTRDSLRRERRQRFAGITVLIAAAVGITLVKVRKPALPPVPQCVADTVSKRSQSQSTAVSDTERKGAQAATETLSVDLEPLQGMVDRIGSRQQHLVPLLHAMNEHYHYLPPLALQHLTELTGIPFDQVSGVASFYPRFRMQPRGKHLVQVCRGTACHVAGADHILEELRRELNIPPDEDTDPAGVATIEAVGCLGCCTLAPVVEVDGQIEGHTTVDQLPAIVDWERLKSDSSGRSQNAVPANAARNGNGRSVSPPLEFRIGLGSCCVAGGSMDVMRCLQQEIADRKLNAVIKQVGCVGICHLTPMVEVIVPGQEPIVATRATAADVHQIVRSLPGTGTWSQRLRNRLNDAWRRDVPHGSMTVRSDCQICPIGDAQVRRFVDPQIRIVTEHSGEMDPTSLEQYREREGFVALQQALNMRPAEIIDVIEASGLRGRGGGGFPTGAKWRVVSQAEGEKILILNGDEGDPGAFMDRMVMESYPFRVLEGMAIAARAVGADRAYLYVRNEYPLAVRRLRDTVKLMTAEGLLGSGIMGTEFDLHVELVEGAGAFVCGEETALLQSIMGYRGIPQLRPPYPAERGLFGRPTLVNNVETFANIPWIIRNGPERFAALGTESSKGTKVFALAGKIRKAGLIEIPLGLTIRDVVENIGGGVGEGKRFKAVQVGGPSGGCIPEALADTPIDYENLKQVGAMLGSGGLVVLDDDDCMVDVARYFLDFTQRESCGHCTFCRVGTRKLLDILERICAGKGKPRDLEEIESLSRSVQIGSLCGLGKTAPNPVLSTLKYFREEYEAHLEGRCPAGRCKALIQYQVSKECVGCTLCAQHCPTGAIPLTPYRQHVIDPDRCSRCDACRVICPEQAIAVV
jgi:NADH-quinone oxidoreductase subunit F